MEFDKENQSPVIQPAYPVVRSNQELLPRLGEVTPELHSIIDEIDTDTDTNTSSELPTAEELLEGIISEGRRPTLERQNAMDISDFNILNIRSRDKVLNDIENMTINQIHKIVDNFKDYHNKYDYLKNEYESRIDRMQLTFENGITEEELEQDIELKRLYKLLMILKKQYIYNLDRLSEELNNNKEMNRDFNEPLYLGNKHKLIKDQINQWRSRCLRNKYQLKRIDEWCLELVVKINDIRDRMASSSH